MLNGLITYFALFFLLIGASFLLLRNTKHRKFSLILLAVCLLLEVTVFNITSYELIGGNYKKQTLDLSKATTENLVIEEDGSLSTVKGGTMGRVVFKDLNERVGTIALDCVFSEDAHTLNVSMDITDETSSGGRNSLVNGEVINGSERSEVIVCNMSGNVKELTLKLTPGSGAVVTIKSITVNQPVPVRFSALRLAVIFVFVFGFYILTNSDKFRITFEDKEKIFRRATLIITIFTVLLAVTITMFYNYYYSSGEGVFGNFAAKSGNQISQEIVDAFRAGQVKLLAEPSDELLALENPYDWSMRSNFRVSALWDHCLYDGNYYSYYGIAPVILLFLPYNLLTNCYFPTAEAILLFGVLGIIFLSLTYCEFIRKFFRNLPLNIYISGLIITLASCGVGYCLCAPSFYEIAQVSGFAFVTMGFYYLLSSNIVGDGKIKYWRLTLATMFLALAVMCRPTLAVYCICAIAFIVFGFLKLRRTQIAEKGKFRLKSADSIKYILASVVCFAVIGGGQMIYNYLRFDSFFDFGIQYSLTINDFTKAEYHFQFVLIGFFNYLFTAPIIKSEFPFVLMNFDKIGVNGYYFIASYNSVGLLYRALPVAAYAFVGKVWRRLNKMQKLTAGILIGMTSVLAPAVIIFSIWESGYGPRYCMDFTWQILFGAFAIAFYLYITSKNDGVKRIAEGLFAVCAILAIIVNFGVMYDYFPRGGVLTEMYKYTESVFEFWK